MTLTVKWGDENYSLRRTEQTLSDSCCLSFGLCAAVFFFFERVLTLNSGRQEFSCQVNIPPLGVGLTPVMASSVRAGGLSLQMYVGLMLRDLPLTVR